MRLYEFLLCFRRVSTTIITALAPQDFMDLIASSVLIFALKTILVKMEPLACPTCQPSSMTTHVSARRVSSVGTVRATTTSRT